MLVGNISRVNMCKSGIGDNWEGWAQRGSIEHFLLSNKQLLVSSLQPYPHVIRCLLFWIIITLSTTRMWHMPQKWQIL